MENYGGGLLAISIDASNYEFDKGEDFIIDYKLCSLISDEQWSIIIENLKDEDSKNNKKLKKFNKRYRKNHYPILKLNLKIYIKLVWKYYLY